ncbi:MAG: MlaD family protein [Desulfuromusa sp.]|nr:MlaD family protein [Desulfuromusa sp.]
MSQEVSNGEKIQQSPVAKIQTKRGFSIIWVVPIIALLIGGGLIFKAQSAKGPTITITFKTAVGLAVGKTKIKFKDVEIGTVTKIELSEDLANIVLTAELNKGTKPYLTDKTQFWVVRARIGAGEVSGLETLFSGAYIGMDPSTEGTKKSEFTGLEIPPALTEGQPGGHYLLKSKTLSSLDFGSPVYYRGIKVGKVVEHHFDQVTEEVFVKVFIQAPFHQKVFQNTRFWSASGIDLTMDATGIKLDTESLVSIMTGGLAFDLREDELPGEIATGEKTFQLYADKESSKENTYVIKIYYLMYFDQNVRGLSPGAPVEIMGVMLGTVVKTTLEYDEGTKKFRIPVLVAIEPERLQAMKSEQGDVAKGETLITELQEESSSDFLGWAKKLAAQGLRAQLKTGNLLTGQLYIDLDYYPDAPAAKVTMEGDYPVFPTIPSPLDQIGERIDQILKQIEALPLNEMGQSINSILRKIDSVPISQIGEEMKAAIESLTQTLDELKSLSGHINQETMPKVNDLLGKLESTIDGINSTLGPNSAINYNAQVMTDELSLTIRSMRSLLEYLEKDPQALIFGKEGDQK